MSPTGNDIWVFGDHMDGRVRPVSLELLSEARRLADAASGQVEVILFGRNCADFAPQLAAHGADQLRIIETDGAESYDPEGFSQTLGDLCQSHEPSLVLFPATSTGADLAARIAAAHGWPLFPRAVDIRTRDGEWEITRALAAGRIHVRLVPSVDGPTLVTFAPEALGTGVQDLTRSATLVRETLAEPGKRKIEVQGFIRARPETIDLTEADTVVSAGRGLGAPENIKLVEALAAALGGSVGGTRVAVDLGWLPKSRQVGQTGKTVRPRLYLACGLSGATQHVMGMKQSETIVAINTDLNAPIFKIADLAVAADAIGLLPALTEKCARAKKGGAT